MGNIKTTFVGGKNPFLNAAIPPDLGPIVQKLKLIKTPVFQNKDVCEALSIKTQRATEYLKKLGEQGIVRRCGKNVAAQLYELTDLAKDALK